MLIFSLILLFLLLYIYVLFPVLLSLLACMVRNPPRPGTIVQPLGISLVTIVHNGEHQIAAKLVNCLELDFSAVNQIEILVVSDGSSDRTVEIVNEWVQEGHPVALCEIIAHKGKNHAIRTMLDRCSGEILIMTDVSARLDKEAVTRIIRWFANPLVGGVCGRKVFSHAGSAVEQAQLTYLSYEDRIRSCEARIASIASNEGFFYAVRKELLPRVPDGVTDDLFVAMSVISRGFRFLYDPKACAALPVRARTPAGELIRRRRIVCGSLLGIAKMKMLLNPFRFPLYSWILFSHKVLRRLVPLLWLLLLLASVILAKEYSFFQILLLLQVVGGIFFSGQHFSLLPISWMPAAVRRLSSTWYYFCLGNWGTFLGLLDCLRGVKYDKWTPTEEHENGK